MKKMPLNISICVLAFCGCELIIDPNLPEHTPRLVIKAFFTPDGGWAASVSRSVGILDADPGPERLIAGAAVELLSDSNVIDRLLFFERERVYGSELALQAGPFLYAASGRRGIHYRFRVRPRACARSDVHRIVSRRDLRPFAR